ncbi:hypothetical protein E4T50_14610 [Aureobasidium sp. EXF-12298]|nr:hypothetical protein E4T50_14610 [Aureobasidium sp. EXF-12298]KAI4752748.1 hypothetical protein E4T51_14095 [Aureobasidium sp. EXF-12344]KAI4769941.1 hypothetical protein E4T52_15026 [Aureobasidium sp. EXF-3400]
MSFSATGVPKPLQSRPKKSPIQLLRSASSPFGNHPRRKAATTPQAGVKRSQSEANTTTEQPLDNSGIVTTLPPPKVPQDVVSLIRYIQEHTWTDIPERAAGMNSTRIAEVLNFRKNMPPIVSIAHLHAVSTSTTATERQLATLIHSGTVKKINIPGRGKGGFAIGEGVILVEDWINTIQQHQALSQELKEKYAKVLEEHTSSYTVPASLFLPDEVQELIAAGFMTSTSALSNDLFSLPGQASSPGSSSLANSWSTAATGTLAATGGASAVHLNGGGGKGLNLTPSTPRSPSQQPQTLTFSLPYTGAYLRLVTEARTHLFSLLVKSSPKYKESTREMLRERWDGGIPLEDAQSRAKRARGEWNGVLPGKTKKWKAFYGVRFEWILEECLGSGGVECFRTGSVGLGVRVT